MDTIEKTMVPTDAHMHKPVWVFAIKSDGRFKVWWSFNGKFKTYGINYLDLYSPVARLENICIVLSLALMHGMLIHQGDVPYAFFIFLLDIDVYMHMPEGFEQQDLVCKLNKGKHLSCGINKFIVIVAQGFCQSNFDNCIYFSATQFMFICLYVDTVLIFGKGNEPYYGDVQTLERSF